MKNQTIKNQDAEGKATVEYRYANPDITKPTTAEDLLKKDIEVVDEAIYNFLPPGLTMLVAASKMGRTRFAIYLAARMTQGSDIFGKYTSRAVRVMYMSLSEDTRRFKHRIEEIADSETGVNPFNFDCITAEDYLGMRFLSRLKAYITKRKLDVVIIDTLEDVMDLRMRGNRRLETEFMIKLRKLANETGTAIIAIHHTKKTDLDANLFQARSLEAASDNVFMIANALQEEGRVISRFLHYGRNYPRKEMWIETRDNGLTFTALEEKPVLETQETILESVKLMRNYGMTQKDIAEVMGLSQGYVSKLANTLPAEDIDEGDLAFDDFDDIEEFAAQDDSEQTQRSASPDDSIGEKKGERDVPD